VGRRRSRRLWGWLAWLTVLVGFPLLAWSGISVQRFGPHAARATAATNALDQGADIAKVQEWLGHANVSTTRVYDHRKTTPEDSPTFKIRY
jgi:integrase/recombinase XerD